MKCISAAILISSLALSFPAAADPTTITGPAGITDGDTLRLGAERVRLFGIDSPERDQVCQRADGSGWRCGADATQALASFIAGREIECEGDERDRYGRLVAVCVVAGQDIGAWMVAEGWALAYRRYSRDYIDEETSAKAAKRGMWSGSFIAPWEWRKAH